MRNSRINEIRPATSAFSLFERSIVRCQVLQALAVLLSLVSLFVPVAKGQTSPPTQSTTPQRAPLPVLYRHFLAYQNHLDRVGATLEKQGKDGSDFKDHFQRKLGFSDAEFGLVRTTANRLEARLREKDDKAKAIIDAIHSQHTRQLNSPADLPVFPPELAQMQKDRDAIIKQEVDQLRGSLGAEKASKLDALIENDFARNMKIENIGPPIPRDSSQNPLPPFKPEVKP